VFIKILSLSGPYVRITLRIKSIHYINLQHDVSGLDSKTFHVASCLNLDSEDFSQISLI
jgi:hypothetical protein